MGYIRVSQPQYAPWVRLGLVSLYVRSVESEHPRIPNKVLKTKVRLKCWQIHSRKQWGGTGSRYATTHKLSLLSSKSGNWSTHLLIYVLLQIPKREEHKILNNIWYGFKVTMTLKWTISWLLLQLQKHIWRLTVKCNCNILTPEVTSSRTIWARFLTNNYQFISISVLFLTVLLHHLSSMWLFRTQPDTIYIIYKNSFDKFGRFTDDYGACTH